MIYKPSDTRDWTIYFNDNLELTTYWLFMPRHFLEFANWCYKQGYGS